MTNILRLVVLIALVVLPGSVLSAPAPPPTTIYDLIIIGSGMSGLGAAKRARELGIRNVLILEARDRIGGRTVTQQLNISMPGNPGTPAFIDLGAAWIHGSYGAARGFNPMSKLANESGPGYVTVSENGLSFSPEGVEDNSNWDTTCEDMLGQWDDYYYRYLDGSIASLRPKGSHSLQTVYNSFLQSKSFSTLQKNALLQTLVTEIVMDYAADLSQLSGPYAEEDSVWGLGPDGLPARGYGTIVSYLARNQTIWTNRAVDVINYSSANFVNVSGRILGGAAGARFSLLARGVINTMPLGYLQAQLAPSTPTLFIPPLNSAQSTAIKSLGMGLLNKVVLVWPNSTWWSSVITTPWLTIRNTTNLGAFSEYYNLAATSLRLPIIICFNGASFARSAESLSNTTTVELALAPLRRLMQQNGRTVPNPVQTIVTRWAADPWTLGSYSYPKAGMEQTARTKAFAPLGAGSVKRVGWAGEHTHSMYPSTTHGAYLSGIREAERLAPIVM